MGYHVYILLCSDRFYYTGHTDNIEARLSAHQQGHVQGYTQKRRPVRLAFAEEMPTRQEVIARERQIKGWSRAKKEALIARDWDRLITLAKRRAQEPDSANHDGSRGT
jgi:predicted GIY-YIG superfamily endonuclease